MKKLSIFLALALIVATTVSASCSYSSRCLNHVKKYEKCSLKAYPDANGYSIGWGHHNKNVKKGQIISQKQADKYLRSDMAAAVKYTNWLIDQLPYDYKFSQGFVDGLTSVVYNAGVGSVKKSTFYARLKRCRVKNGKMNKKDYDYAVAAIKTTAISQPGHKQRRADEYAMMK